MSLTEILENVFVKIIFIFYVVQDECSEKKAPCLSLSQYVVHVILASAGPIKSLQVFSVEFFIFICTSPQYTGARSQRLNHCCCKCGPRKCDFKHLTLNGVVLKGIFSVSPKWLIFWLRHLSQRGACTNEGGCTNKPKKSAFEMVIKCLLSLLLALKALYSKPLFTHQLSQSPFHSHTSGILYPPSMK